ncbi:hypothetical protein [Mammaliicoccus sp. D-M17]|uniref:DUF2483 family protein n=1 Tax=Mammaliicoccus sp. D-M17 TaxID=2898677 RepID=UPI001EFB5C29|nr:hypothetical protein [Mammaliicoccus sp. D-M17]
MSEKVEVTYRVIEESSGNYLVNYPTHPDNATYGKLFSKAAKLTGFQKINLDWEKHLIQVNERTIIDKYKTVRMSDLEELENE